MKHTEIIILCFLLGYEILCSTLPTKAGIETTTIKTTTYSNQYPVVAVIEKQSITTTGAKQTGKLLTLPATTTYIIVDPFTGLIEGAFDPMRELIDVYTIAPGSVLIDRVTGKILATLSPSGQAVDIVSTPALDALAIAIDSRQANLSRMITACLSDGSIDTKQASALRSQLDQIATQESLAKQKAGILPYSEALSLALALNDLSDRLVLLAHSTPLSPILGSKMVNNNGVLSLTDDTTYRRMKIGQRIDDEYAAGRLSAQQVANLKEQLNVAASLDAKYRDNEKLSTGKAEKIAAKLDNIEVRLNRDVAMINDRRAKIGIKVQ